MSGRSSVWLVRLISGLRTALACLIVGCTTLYAPAPIRLLIGYPAFSYMTTILIVSDATLGDTLRGSWHALYATILALVPCTLTLWMVGPDGFTTGLAAAAVTITSFMVSLPESTPMMSKRIAFGQIVIVYVDAVVNGRENTGVLMHPIHVASSTALGALASNLAMLLPYPRLAYYEARRECRLYMENASERMDLLVKAFSAKDKQAAIDLITQAKFLSQTGVRHLQDFIDSQRSLIWERPHLRLFDHNLTNPGENLQEIETKLRGLQIAITSCQSFPVGINDEGLVEELLAMKKRTSLKLSQAKRFTPFCSKTAPDTTNTSSESFLWTPKTNATTHEDLSALFFIFCMQLLQGELPIRRCSKPISGNIEKTNTQDTIDQAECRIMKTWKSLIPQGSRERWTFALKCSLSLGFAVFLGLLFNKKQAYWSGLTIAISFEKGRQALLTIANARVQGTALGSIYGIIWCFVFQHFIDFRFLPLLPWIIFTAFLRHSRMYGKAGATAAVIGALLILGRKKYGIPSEFAVARLTEAAIGLSCFITFEFVLQPTRASSVAKTELAWSLRALRSCVEDMSICSGQENGQLRDRQKMLKYNVNNLEKFIADAELEPNFWFLPFNGGSYNKILESLRKMMDLLLFAACEIEIILAESDSLGLNKKELEELLDRDLDHFRGKVASSLEFLEEVSLIKSLSELDDRLQMDKVHCDVEAGKAQCEDRSRLGPEEEEVLEIVESFLQHSIEVSKKLDNNEVEQLSRSKMTLCLTSLGFCINTMMRETIQIENELKNLITWENPSRHVNLYEISCKIHNLPKK
ncbi:hypothetical protein K2173_002156 [Erythroxylum novogranatense]|uniref:p-hydroxybenzoic acid efflux pump subunit n=1 Tax=Erythroxylum novogranatense TaxID=1862640 RepID=A0AAV8SPQ7_9ROSI|nr:hypothetical protein K2173_002156 [Erythroxylum novogranatense]